VGVELFECSGAAGGICGAIVALGGALASGLDAAASSVNLRERIARSSLVITGEGLIDEGSLEDKVTVGVAELVGDSVPLLVVCGSIEPGAACFDFDSQVLSS
jgi:glycerate kinase